ncbi:LysM peptidoglycan-binding domain-containing M23 family metallopeptidase [Streptomyces sp. NBC_00536]|uniref:M23 family metallopeptidase n=1 Tax=Streptomyces sp. NBC_00536 TaxID=2975769 RepID=UPI002E805554|nr:LysM peptidoglycan-binding domain-containing M23 family metallopeptidase [Streptomyces sp. NBC_00536]WUC82293.1 LysM peptidoglycan-binding domain-containing M23 family metallopeptidase [Streptomyces sp. NBC_00536]
MPAKGKHRRPKSASITRGFVVAGTGSAALALPLMGAAGAHAATGTTATTAVALPAQVRPAQVPVALRAPAAAPQASTVYTVVPGDYLSKIAAERHLSGGWQRVYEDNHEAVGSDPSLIHPGLKLTLGARAQEQTPAPAPAEQSAEEPTPADSGPADSGAEDSGTGDSGTADAGTGSTGSTGSQATGSGTGTASAAGFVAPVSASITTPYRQSGSMWSSGYHTGVDFAVGTGTTVHAVGAGTVVSAGWGGAYGNEVVIRHADGRYSQYGHMSQLSVSVGQSVSAGQAIGLSGATGNVTGPHLHFEIRTGPGYGTDIDPLGYLRSKGVNV